MGRDESGTGWDESGTGWDESAARASTAGRHRTAHATKRHPSPWLSKPHALRRWAWTGIGSYKPKAVRPRARDGWRCVCFGRVPRLTALGLDGHRFVQAEGRKASGASRVALCLFWPRPTPDGVGLGPASVRTSRRP